MEHREIGVVEAVRLIIVFSIATCVIPWTILLIGFVLRILSGIVLGVIHSLQDSGRRVLWRFRS